jgi:hypothetical protein
MRLTLLLITLIFLLPIWGCGTLKTGKTIAIDNPIEASRTKKSLNDARRDVKESRRILDQCLEQNEGDETKCELQKDDYDRDVEIYVSFQQ